MTDPVHTFEACTYLRADGDSYVQCKRPATERVLYEPLATLSAKTVPRCKQHAAAEVRRKWRGTTTRGLPL